MEHAGNGHQSQFTVDQLNGIVVPLITPLATDNEIDQSSLTNLVEHVIDGGVSGIFILGTTGEAPSLSRRMREEMIGMTCQFVRQRVPVLVGVSDTSSEDALHLARCAKAAGASAIVIAPPYYFNAAQTDLFRFLKHVARFSELPIFLYNIPSLTKVKLGVEMVTKAAEVPNVIGLKDSSGDVNYIAQVKAACPELPVFIGPEELFVEGIQAGASGGVCGGANLNPHLFVQMYEAALAGDWSKAGALQARVREASAALYTVGDSSSSYLRGLKTAMAARGLCRPVFALPFGPMSDAESALIQERALQFGDVTV